LRRTLVQQNVMQLFLIVLLGVLMLLYGSLLLYYRSAWVSILNYVERKSQEPLPFISVLIPARNEAHQVSNLLQSLEVQQFPGNSFEVIVIDDHSTDHTVDVVESFIKKTTIPIRIISLRETLKGEAINSYKKKAIETGIAQSRGELIVTTDADCVVPPLWLSTIANVYQLRKPKMIVMPVGIEASLRPIEIFQSLDFMTLQGITGAALHKNFHGMCNGANLAYTKESFYAVNGFTGIDSIASGDDMLLLHKIKDQFPEGICYIKSKDVIVYTKPVVSLGAFFQQRIRWASKSDQYSDKTLLPVLLLVYFFNLLLLLTGILCFFVNSLPIVTILSLPFVFGGVIILKTILELIFLYPVSVFFGKQKLLWFFPLFQPLHIIYTVAAGWLGKFGTYEWKERKVK